MEALALFAEKVMWGYSETVGVSFVAVKAMLKVYSALSAVSLTTVQFRTPAGGVVIRGLQ